MLPESLTGWRRQHATGLRRAGVLVPLTLLSASWTLSVPAVGGPRVTVAAERGDPAPLVGVPEAPVEAPASITAGRAVRPADSRAVPTAAMTEAIPPVALAAYQRAETIIGVADPACHLDWPLLAAIGKVESDHGQFGDSRLGVDGVARPGIVGIALNGTRGTALVSDTDGGRYDDDMQFDRAVGPLQFIPTTWGVVGVDADGDGNRDPQDIDDAARAAAVYLCSGTEDLGEASGMRRAVLRYNHSMLYANQVLAAAHAYATQGFAPLAAGLAVLPEGAEVVDGVPVHDTRGGTVRGIRAATQPTHVREPAPKPAGPKPSNGGAGGGTGGGEVPPAPKPTGAPLAPLTETLQCTLASLDKLLQPDWADDMPGQARAMRSCSPGADAGGYLRCRQRLPPAYPRGATPAVSCVELTPAQA